MVQWLKCFGAVRRMRSRFRRGGGCAVVVVGGGFVVVMVRGWVLEAGGGAGAAPVGEERGVGWRNEWTSNVTVLWEAGGGAEESGGVVVGM